MPLQKVTFADWLRSHVNKDPEERWLRELYPWPVLAQTECDNTYVGREQHIIYDGVEYNVTLKWMKWQPNHGTFKYRILVESPGLGWHARSWCDEFDMCGAPDGTFVTVFHTKKEEPLERIARAFFGRRWGNLDPASLRTLAVSRFLAATIVGEVVEHAFPGFQLEHYPGARLIGDASPMFAAGRDLWVGYRFFSEDAYSWARGSAGRASRVVALYFADTKYQFKTDLPSGTEVLPITHLDMVKLGGRNADLIIALLRELEMPVDIASPEQLEPIVLGHVNAGAVAVAEADVNEALAALKRPCSSKAELRYQLAAGVVVNAWVEAERRLGFSQRKKFYAFKQRINALAEWADDTKPPGVRLWAELLPGHTSPVLYIRINSVDFSFHAIPFARSLLDDAGHSQLVWSGVRLKPIAPIVLAWARTLLNT